MATKTQKVVNIHAAKTQLSKLIEEVLAGEEVIIAKAGTPVAKLSPLNVPAKAPRRLGLHSNGTRLSDEAAAESLRPLDPEEAKLWE